MEKILPPSLIAPGHNQLITYGEQSQGAATPDEENLSLEPVMRLDHTKLLITTEFITMTK